MWKRIKCLFTGHRMVDDFTTPPGMIVSVSFGCHCEKCGKVQMVDGWQMYYKMMSR